MVDDIFDYQSVTKIEEILKNYDLLSSGDPTFKGICSTNSFPLT